MGALTPGTLWKRGLDVLNTVVDATTKTITAMLGDAVGEETSSANAEWWQHVGFASRPSKPTKGQPSAQVVTLTASDEDAVIASRDVRGQVIYGALSHGETCIYASGEDGASQGRVLLKTDGSINVYTRAGNTSGGAGMAIMVTPATNTISLVNGLGFGIIISEVGLKFTAGDSAISLNADGSIKITAKGQAQIDGATVVLGSIAIPLVNAALKGPTGIAGVASLKVLIE